MAAIRTYMIYSNMRKKSLRLRKQRTIAEKNSYLVEDMLVDLQGSLGTIIKNMGKHY